MFKLSCNVSKTKSTIFTIQVQIMYVKLILFEARHDVYKRKNLTLILITCNSTDDIMVSFLSYNCFLIHNSNHTKEK